MNDAGEDIASDNPIDRFRFAARRLHRQAQRGEAQALETLRELPELARLDDAELGERVQRRHCLALLARRLDMPGWPALRAVLEGHNPDDFGTALHPDRCGGHWNIWSAHYPEARAIRTDHGGYLLVYKRHFLIVDHYYIETLGLEVDDPDWERIGRDWARPLDAAARGRLYARLALL